MNAAIFVVNANRTIDPVEIEGFNEFFNMTLEVVWHRIRGSCSQYEPEQASLASNLVVHGEILHKGNQIYLFVVNDEYLCKIPMFNIWRETTNTFVLFGAETAASRFGGSPVFFDENLERYRIWGNFRIENITIHNDKNVYDVITGRFIQVWAFPYL